MTRPPEVRIRSLFRRVCNKDRDRAPFAVKLRLDGVVPSDLVEESDVRLPLGAFHVPDLFDA